MLQRVSYSSQNVGPKSALSTHSGRAVEWRQLGDRTEVGIGKREYRNQNEGICVPNEKNVKIFVCERQTVKGL